MHSLSALSSKIRQLEANYTSLNKQHITINGNEIMFLISGKIYKPSKTADKFHNSNKQVRLVMGAYGSGKSTMCAMDIILRACKMPKCLDGIRRAKVAIIRNTYAELETTALATWWDWCSDLGNSRKVSGRTLACYHQFNDGNGIIELEVLFMALDRDADIKRFKSLEITYAYLNEASELPSSAVMHLQSRTGRYPARDSVNGQAYWCGLLLDTNPPDTDSWIYKTFEENMDESFCIFKQPPGLIKIDGKYVTNSLADNLDHLRIGYYESLAAGATEDFIKVYCLGEYGVIRDGKPVYPQYNDDLHSVEHISIVPRETVYLGFDGGLTPACLVMQVVEGQLRAIQEFTTDRMGMIELSEIVDRWIKTNCIDNPIYAVCDPACTKGDELNSDLSAYNILAQKFGCVPALTNDIQPRIESVNYFLNKMIAGNTAYKLSRKGCPQLRKGFLNSYIYKRMRVLNREEYRDVPNKTHPFSDIHDCQQYISLNYNGNGAKMANNQFDIKQFINHNTSMWA